MIVTALVTLLKANAGCGDRIYSGGEIVNATVDLPKVVYTDLSGTRLYSDDGNTGLVKGRFQLDIFAAQPSAARAIAESIRVAIDGHAATIDGTEILRIYFPEPPRMQKAELPPVGQTGTAARYSLDLVVDYRETTDITVVNVEHVSGFIVTWTFSSAVTLAGANVPELEIDFDGFGGWIQPTSCAQGSTTAIVATYVDGPDITSGWRILAKPSNINQSASITVPQSGLIA